MKVFQLDSKNFAEEVLKNGQIVLVDFYADWCGPCKMMAPIVEKIAEDFLGKVKVCKINIDEANEIAEKYGIMSIPTFIVFKNGKIENTVIGMQSEQELKQIIEL